MIERVLTYVRSVLAGEIQGDPVVGRYLMDALCTNTEGLDKAGFASSLQVSTRSISLDVLIFGTDLDAE